MIFLDISAAPCYSLVGFRPQTIPLTRVANLDRARALRNLPSRGQEARAIACTAEKRGINAPHRPLSTSLDHFSQKSASALDNHSCTNPSFIFSNLRIALSPTSVFSIPSALPYSFSKFHHSAPSRAKFFICGFLAPNDDTEGYADSRRKSFIYRFYANFRSKFFIYRF
jgi:hypothetical protein